jgi:hypothetical protein
VLKLKIMLNKRLFAKQKFFHQLSLNAQKQNS